MRADDGYEQVPDDPPTNVVEVEIKPKDDSNTPLQSNFQESNSTNSTKSSGTPQTVIQDARDSAKQTANNSNGAAKRSSKRSTVLAVNSSDVHYQQSVSTFSVTAVQSQQSNSPPKTISYQTSAVIEEIISSTSSAPDLVVSTNGSTATNGNTDPAKAATTSTTSTTAAIAAVPAPAPAPAPAVPVSKSQPILQGMSVYLKFMIESRFEPRFIWIDLKKKTLHMSQHKAKDRRHKEANLSDIVTVEKPNPQSFAMSSLAVGGLGSSGGVDGTDTPTSTSSILAAAAAAAAASLSNVNLTADVYATVKFVRGGGVDIRFESTEDRDHFYTIITTVVSKLKAKGGTGTTTATTTTATGTGAGTGTETWAGTGTATGTRGQI